jgi:hypothetical protein
LEYRPTCIAASLIQHVVEVVALGIAEHASLHTSIAAGISRIAVLIDHVAAATAAAALTGAEVEAVVARILTGLDTSTITTAAGNTVVIAFATVHAACGVGCFVPRRGREKQTPEQKRKYQKFPSQHFHIFFVHTFSLRELRNESRHPVRKGCGWSDEARLPRLKLQKNYRRQLSIVGVPCQ